MIKVAIDKSPLISEHNVRGIGVNTKELIENIGKIKNKDVSVELIDINPTEMAKYDLVHITHFNPHFFSFPLNARLNNVLLTVHDVISLKYPKHYPPGIKGRIRFMVQKLMINKIAGVLTISEDSKKDIEKYLGVKKEKIHVVLLAAKQVFGKNKDSKQLEKIKNKYNLPDKFVLYVGDMNYNKNIPCLIKACRELKSKLVIVGKKAKDIEGWGMDLMDMKGPKDWIRFLLNKPHPETAHYKAIYDEFKKSKNIIRTGYVSDFELTAIYNLATLYVQPSFSEGFGLSVLEAQACGTPVIASNIGAHREIAKESVVYFNPNSDKDLMDKIERVLGNNKTQKDLSERGLINSKRFNWLKTASEVIDVYKKTAQGF